MSNLKTIYDVSDRSASSITVGNFDGLHLGHRDIIAALVDKAEQTDSVPTLVTFDPHPRRILSDEQPELLTTVSERAERCRKLGIERFVTVRFDLELASFAPERFVSELLVDGLGMTSIVLGHDHRFGKRRQGDEQALKALGTQLGFNVQVVGPTRRDGTIVSSSAIRSLLSEGIVGEATDLLGYRYSLDGRVEHGAARGRTIGFPTANLNEGDSHKLIPANGVYAVNVRLPDGSQKGGMLNIGTRPTFGGDRRHVEVHILDWKGDLYGREVRVEFVSRLRDERRFESVEALVAQLNVDRERCTAELKRVT